MFGRLSLVAAVFSLSSVMASGVSQAADVRGTVRIGDVRIVIGPGLKRHHPYAHYKPERRCVAVARRGGGAGRRIHRIKGVGFGRRACRKAMNQCWRKLDRRQARGRNPYASCVVHRRFVSYRGPRFEN